MRTTSRGALVVSVGLLLSCDRDVVSTPPDEHVGQPPDEAVPDSAPMSEEDPAAPPLDTSFRVEGGLSKEQIQSVIDKQFTPIRECFDQALERVDHIDTGGAIMVRWVVGTRGDVTDAELEGSRFGDPETERCIVDEVQRWAFPAPKKKPATVHYPFYLRSY
jgi:hypothetical protein